MFLPTTSAGQDMLLRQRRVIFDVTVQGESPSSAVRHSSDAPGAIFLQTAGHDDCTADDSDCNFVGIQDSPPAVLGVLVDGPKALGGEIDKLFSLSVAEVTSVAGTLTVTKAGDSTSGLTTKKNLAFTVAGSTADFASQTVTLRVTLECQIDQEIPGQGTGL